MMHSSHHHDCHSHPHLRSTYLNPRSMSPKQHRSLVARPISSCSVSRNRPGSRRVDRVCPNPTGRNEKRTKSQASVKSDDRLDSAVDRFQQPCLGFSDSPRVNNDRRQVGLPVGICLACLQGGIRSGFEDGGDRQGRQNAHADGDDGKQAAKRSLLCVRKEKGERSEN